MCGEKESFVDRPEDLWLPEECDFAFYGSEGTTDILNLSRITHIRIDDDFGMHEARMIWQ